MTKVWEASYLVAEHFLNRFLAEKLNSSTRTGSVVEKHRKNLCAESTLMSRIALWIHLLQYSCGLANIPAPPLLKTLDVSDASSGLTTRGCRSRWSLGLNVPSGSLLCMYASLARMFLLGIIDMSLIPSGLKTCFFKYASSVSPVARSSAIPAQSMPT